jgi:hypothetical protein
VIASVSIDRSLRRVATGVPWSPPYTDPKLALRIYAQVVKRQDAELYRAAANELLGISPHDTAAEAADEVPATVPAEWSE